MSTSCRAGCSVAAHHCFGRTFDELRRALCGTLSFVPTCWACASQAFHQHRVQCCSGFVSGDADYAIGHSKLAYNTMYCMPSAGA